MADLDGHFEFGGVLIQPDLNTVLRDGDAFRVSPRVMDALAFLVENRDRVVSADELLETFWAGRVVEESTVHRLISQVRGALGDSASEQRFIKTISKRGYQAVADVVLAEPVDAESQDSEAAKLKNEPATPLPAADPAADIAQNPLPAALPAATNSRNKAWMLAVAALGVVVFALGFFALRDAKQLQRVTMSEHAGHEHLETVAVLPFLNLSDAAEFGFFARGLSDLLLDRLAQSEVLRVASQTSSFQLAEQGLDVQTIAQRLQVAYVIEGSVQAVDNDLRVTVQLIRGADGYHVWSKIYDAVGEKLLQIQQQVAQNAAIIAESRIYNDGPRQFPQLFSAYEGVDPRAAKFYLDAQDIYTDFALGDGGDMAYALRLTESAVSIDPDFAAAHNDLAWHYIFRTDPSINVQVASAGAHAAIKEALRLNPEDADALFFLVQVYKDLDLNYAEAERLTLQQIRETPDGAWWSAFLSNIADREGRHDDAARHFATSLARIDAFGAEAPFILIAHANVLLRDGKPEQVLQVVEDALDLTHEGRPRAELLLARAQALCDLGREIEARADVDAAWSLAGAQMPSRFAPLFLRLGDESRARQVLAGVTPENRNRGDFVQFYLDIGDLQAAFAMTRDAIEDHDGSVLDKMRAPGMYDAVRSDPRFLELLRRLESKETPTASFLAAQDDQGI